MIGHGSCKGTGRVYYTDNNGNRQYSSCVKCSGRGYLKYALELSISWLAKTYIHVSTESKIRITSLKEAEGIKIFEDANTTILPVNYLSDNTVSEASRKLINSNASTETGLASLWRQQSIKIIPIATVHYKEKNDKNEKIKTIWIYGSNLDVYAPDLGAKCSLM